MKKLIEGIRTGIFGFRESILTKILGIDIVVLGMAGSGKTTFHEYIRNGGKKLTERYISTVHQKNVAKGKFKDNEFKVRFKEGIDTPGSNTFVDTEWKKLFNSSDICIYLIDIESYLNIDRHNEKVVNQLNKIFSWNVEFKKSKNSIFIVFSFLDKINLVNEVELINKLRNEILRDLTNNQNITSANDIFLGSLKDKQSSDKLIIEIIKCYKNKSK
jgi:GTPase SAR1 family protein